MFQPVVLGETYCATAAVVGDVRDTDWFVYSLPGPGTFTVVGQPQFRNRWTLLEGPATIVCFFGPARAGPVVTSCGNPDLMLSLTVASATEITFLSLPDNFSSVSSCGVNANYWFRGDFAPRGSCDSDFNCDGNSDQDDVACIINVVAGNPGCQCQDPDFNQDGNDDQDDVAALINVVAGGLCP